MGTYHGPINPDPAPGDAHIIIYGYIPSLSLGIPAVLLFALLLLVNFIHLLRSRETRSFEILLLVGTLMELVGYGFRVASHFHPFKVMDFVLQYVFIVCAPILFAAAIYLALATILKRTANIGFPLSPKAVVTYFVVADVVTILTQVAGAGLVGSSESSLAEGSTPFISPDHANDILLAGLATQNFFFSIFLVLLGIFIFRLSRAPTAVRNAAATPPPALLAVLAASALLIFLRTLFRLAETAEGVFGPLMVSEGWFAGLEFMPVIVALALWAAYPLHRGLKQMEHMESRRREIYNV